MSQTTPTTAIALRPPTMAVLHSPMDRVHAKDMQAVGIGVSLASLAPKTEAQLRCFVNGTPVFQITQRQWAHHLKLLNEGDEEGARKYLAGAYKRRMNWHRTITQPGDVITWHEVVASKDTLRTVLQIAALVVAIWNPAGYGAVLALGISAVSAILLPPSTPGLDAQQQGGTVYSTSLTGNQARLDQPIWRNCGVVKVTPPFAAQPYGKFVRKFGTDLDNDQYYYACFCLGYGRHDIIRTYVGTTPLEELQDVVTFNHLVMGERPHVVLCNIETSEQVQNIELDSNGVYGGPFVACKPMRRVYKVGIDMAAPQGIGTTSDAITLKWRVEYCIVDDYGRAVGNWVSFGEETRTEQTNTPQRWTSEYELPSNRVMIRVVRTDIKNTAVDARAALSWVGLKGFVDVDVPLDPLAEHVEIVIRASEQLSAVSERSFSMLVQGYARTFDKEKGWNCDLYDFENYVATRNGAWYLADLWLDAHWGEGVPEDRVDCDSLADLAAIYDARQDRFDFTFDSSMQAWDAAKLIAGTGRATPFRRFGVYTAQRDQLETLPRSGFSPRNTIPGSMVVTETHPVSSQVADGVLLEYTNNVTWDIDTIECPAPGYTVTDPTSPEYDATKPSMANPTYIRIEGVKGKTHAKREGLYRAWAAALRTRTWGVQVEMQGLIPSVLDPVRWQPEIQGFAQSGDVTHYDPATRVLSLSEKPDFAAADESMLSLIRDDGSLTAAVLVSAGPTPYDVVLPSAPDFTLVTDDAMRERPKYFFGDLDEIGKVTSVRDGGRSNASDGTLGSQLFDIEGFIDDERVHQVDNYLLPGPGDIQDPIDDGTSIPGGGGDDTGGTLLLVNLKDHDIGDYFLVGHAGPSTSFTLRNDGTAAKDDNAPFLSEELPNEWLQYNPVDTVRAGLFEVRFSYLGGGKYGPGVIPYPPSGVTLNTWLPLSSNYTLTFATGPDTPGVEIQSYVKVEIRQVSTGTIQCTRFLTFFVRE